METAEFIIGFDLDKLVESWLWPVKMYGSQPTSSVGIQNWKTEKYDKWEDLCQNLFAQEVESLDAGYLYLYSEGPIFKVTFSEVAPILDEIIDFSVKYHKKIFAFVRADCMAGIMVDNYCGFLHEESEDEIVYELCSWGI